METKQYIWILLKSKGHVSGLYYEDPGSRKIITKLGISDDGISPKATLLNPQYYCACVIPGIAGPNVGLFLTVATLSDIRKVDLCRIGSRCTGILIHYHTGLKAVLGQWHANGFSKKSCIYDGSRSFTKICFRMVASKRHKMDFGKMVSDISFSEDNSEDVMKDSEYQMFGIGTVMS